MTNLVGNLIEAARRYPERVALRLNETEIPFGSLDAASARLAGVLVARGLRPGDRVGVMLPNVSCFAVAYSRRIRHVRGAAGGGSPGYANTLYRARPAELTPRYDTAERIWGGQVGSCRSMRRAAWTTPGRTDAQLADNDLIEIS